MTTSSIPSNKVISSTKVIPPTKVEPKLSPKQKLYLQITDVLKGYNNLESDIPVNHDYWKWLNTYRSLE